MNRRAWIWVIVAAIVLIAGLVVGRGSPSKSAQTPAGRGQGGGQRPVPTVAVGHARNVRLPQTLQLTASINSLTQAVVLPKTSGYLQTVTVRAGDTVRAGQVVAVVDHGQLDAQVAQAQAQVAAAETGVHTAQAQVAAAHAQTVNAQAGLVKAKAQLQDAQASFIRTQTLAQQGAVSQQSLDDARANVDSARASVEAAQAQVDAAREQEAAAVSQVRTQQAQVSNQMAALENARLGLQYATIVAPFSGVVVSRSLDPGAYVTPGTSTPILTLADPDHLDVIVNISEATLPLVHKGDKVRIMVDAYPDRVFQGVVTRIAGGLDPMTRTAQTEIDLPNPGRLLRVGMYARVQITAGTQPALVVPLSALVTVGGQHLVWVVTDGKVSQQPVTVGRATGDVVEITSGLSEQDTIIIRGTDLVHEGQTVRSVPGDQGTRPGP
jgi:multidrug resistance efflux pump